MIPIILLPILTRALSIVEFADYAIYKTIVTLLTPIIGFALPTYLLKNFYSELKNKEKSFLVNAFYFSLIITLFISLISCIFPDTLYFRRHIKKQFQDNVGLHMSVVECQISTFAKRQSYGRFVISAPIQVRLRRKSVKISDCVDLKISNKVNVMEKN